MDEVLVGQTGSITESLTTGDCVRPGCLGILRGPIADWGNSTRNRRFYSRELWVKVFDTDWVKEAIETRTLFGEADHPEERIEPLLTQAAVVLTDYEFRDDEKVVYGTFDILDTPSGRILRTLADYGCELGVSSRGRGQVVSRNGRQEVDPDSYVFGGFDVVALPAVKKARQSFIGESGTEDLRIDIADQIAMCESESDLMTVKGILDTANLPDRGGIDRLIEARMSEFHSADDDTFIAGLTRDLREACGQVRDLKAELRRMSRTAKADAIGDGVLATELREVLRENGVIDTIEDDEIADEVRYLIEDRDREIAELSAGAPSAGSGTEPDEVRREAERLAEELEIRDGDVERLESVVNMLREALDTARGDLAAAQRTASDALSELGSVKADYEDLAEGYDSLVAANRELTERHLNEQALRLNISRNDLVRLLPEGYDVGDIDSAVDEQMSLRRKLNRLPVSGGAFPSEGLDESYTTRLPSSRTGDSLESTRKILTSMQKERRHEQPAFD